MPVVKELKELLDKQNIKYVTISHSLAYTAQETAELAHVSGKEIAKTVIMKIDGVLAMAVLPGSCQIDVSALKSAAGAQTVELAREPEFRPRRRTSHRDSRTAAWHRSRNRGTCG